MTRTIETAICRRIAWIATSAAWLALGCSGNAAGPFDSVTGGANGIGGSSTTGTTQANGGSFSSGGAVASGGAPTTSASTGGAANVGGAATGGASGNGGSASVGGSNVGGAAIGGNSSGGSATGGKSAGGAATGGAAAGGAATGGKATGGMAAGGTSNIGGNATGGKAVGGASTTGGVAIGGAATGGAAGGGTVPGCPTPVAVNRNPFNCKFAWGGGTASASTYLNFIIAWTGYETNGGLSAWTATATNSSCNGCTLARNLATSTTIPAFYAYTAAYAGHNAASHGWSANLPDCNVGGPPNLCTDGAAFILANYDIIINSYAQYAKAVYNAAPNKAAIWLIEGDISQYANSGQQIAPGPMTWAQLGKFAGDITCAIKANQPSAMVYVNHSYWLNTATTTAMFNAMPNAILDGLWMGGSPATTTMTGGPVTYAALHALTGLPLYVGGQGASQPNWVSATAANLNLRIADGVIAADIDPMPSNAQTLIAGFATTLNSTCN